MEVVSFKICCATENIHDLTMLLIFGTFTDRDPDPALALIPRQLVQSTEVIADLPNQQILPHDSARCGDELEGTPAQIGKRYRVFKATARAAYLTRRYKRCRC